MKIKRSAWMATITLIFPDVSFDEIYFILLFFLQIQPKVIMQRSSQSRPFQEPQTAIERDKPGLHITGRCTGQRSLNLSTILR